MATSLGEPGAPSGVGAPRREDFWNLPNTITVFRMAAVPALLALPIWPGPTGSRIVAWIFIVAAVSDIVDGWLARRGQQVTKIGQLLDPLADKLLVTTSLIVLLSVGRIPEWALLLVVVIIGRELAVTGLRGLASIEGLVMPARGAGKLKAVAQNVAICALLFPKGTLGLPNHAIGMSLLAVATVLTLWSGWIYFADYFRDESPPAS